MKISVLLFIAGTVVAALSLGAWIASIEQNSVPVTPQGVSIVLPDDLEFAPEGGPQPRVEVAEPSHDFGEMTPETEGSNTFVFLNRGDYVLHLKEGPTDCRCMVSEAEETPAGSGSERAEWTKKVPPGESAKVTLKWKTNRTPGLFRKQATIWTNDRLQSRVELTIYGTIRPRVEIRPSFVHVSQMLSDETMTKELRVLAAHFDHLAIVDHRLEKGPTAEFLEVKYEPLPAEQVETGFASGALVTVTIKPGLPYGESTQTIWLTTNVPKLAEPRIPVRVDVRRDITVAGSGYNSRNGVLTLGVVDSAEGVKKTLMLLVRGPHQADVKFQTPASQPDCLRVVLGEAKQLGNVTQVPLSVEIAPGAAPISRLGLEQGKLGEIIIETSHPRIKEIRIPVKFAVEG